MGARPARPVRPGARALRALELLRRTGDRHGEANTWDSLGFVHARLGDHREAIRCYGRALRLYRVRALLAPAAAPGAGSVTLGTPAMADRGTRAGALPGTP
ncbi:tetratricopeptide repeat protein [Micromonospora sp. DT4]|uniref:tetratricopeptide repeat protein n=1 Tax=Micromonospora sp. DT4 TaxID=3393438 RepID=UPI003CF32E9E